jgi:hypothetical protein
MAVAREAAEVAMMEFQFRQFYSGNKFPLEPSGSKLPSSALLGFLLREALRFIEVIVTGYYGL